MRMRHNLVAWAAVAFSARPPKSLPQDRLQPAMTMDDLVSVQVFSTDLSAIDEFNRVYRTYFTKEYPARAFVGVADLNGSRFELTGVAVRR